MYQKSRIQPIFREYQRKLIVKNSPPEHSLASQRATRYQDKDSRTYLFGNEMEDDGVEPKKSKRYGGEQLFTSGPQISPKNSLSSEMMKLLIEENNNLKEQNKYLHEKLRMSSSKETELVETILEYETIMSSLNTQNEQLQKEVLYFSEKANNRVDKLGQKLGKLLNKKQHVRHQREENVREFEETHSNVDKGERERQRERERERERYFQVAQSPTYNQSPNAFKRIKSQERMIGRSGVDRSAVEIENINNEFEALLYSCRMEVNPEKRKELRRKLVQLTYKKNPAGY